MDWKKLDDLIPKSFKKESRYEKTGKAGSQVKIIKANQLSKNYFIKLIKIQKSLFQKNNLSKISIGQFQTLYLA